MCDGLAAKGTALGAIDPHRAPITRLIVPARHHLDALDAIEAQRALRLQRVPHMSVHMPVRHAEDQVLVD